MSTNKVKSKNFKVIITGDLDFEDYALMTKYTMHVLKNKSNICILSGMNKGAEALGEEYAIDNRLGLLPYTSISEDPIHLTTIADAAVVFCKKDIDSYTSTIIESLKNNKVPYRIRTYSK